MKGIIHFALLTLILTSCLIKEDPVSESNVYGLYKRDYYKTNEFICLDRNKNYIYYTKDDGQLKTLTRNVWHFDLTNGESRIGLSKFDYLIALKKYAKTPYGISTPILYSHAKKATVIRMSVDDHFQDFIKIDSLCTTSE